MRLMLLLLFAFVPLSAIGQTAAPAPAAKKGNRATEFQMKEGSYLSFAQVNLSLGEIGFRVEVASEHKKSNARLEFRIDKPKGKIIGTLEIPYTGDSTYALKLTGNLRHAEGVHDLYLVARGAMPFSITSFGFIYNY
ncbi:carbohydrate binding protein with CBM6 domain [Chitinophaga polysaccharea]|uniref:Carbohydrate binding protein with CBM6 domain n=1 Tax=Chitinophaga polysaccharea TaxID=1293035 RepID=A0A561PAY9_9BACT|nr:carbohydrate-binding protein [Chitinophaga polysaccharea]TWF35301.1 carbohydrate binding protein with CBM6 domain [Chitinophaga polysaccharea]